MRGDGFQDELLDRLAGRWVLRGAIHGAETVHDVSADWVLGHHYLRIHELARERDDAGRAAYEALVFIGRDPRGEGYACLWLDDTGGGGLAGDAIGEAKREGDAMLFVFRDRSGAISLTNRFAYDSCADAWTWTINNVQDGKAELFASVKLTRHK
jgi:hypothetical protein